MTGIPSWYMTRGADSGGISGRPGVDVDVLGMSLPDDKDACIRCGRGPAVTLAPVEASRPVVDVGVRCSSGLCSVEMDRGEAAS